MVIDDIVDMNNQRNMYLLNNHGYELSYLLSTS
jgi:hypothetical protein